MEKRKRSLAKMISWRIIATSTTMIVVYALTMSLEIMTIAGSIEFVAKMFLYYGHERAWANVSRGYVNGGK